MTIHSGKMAHSKLDKYRYGQVIYMYFAYLVWPDPVRPAPDRADEARFSRHDNNFLSLYSVMEMKEYSLA